MEELRTVIRAIQTILAILSSFLLMLGLVIAMTNFLLGNELFILAPWLNWFWAVSQSLAVDSNLAVVFGIVFTGLATKNWLKVGVYGILGVGLAFTAIVITDTEAVRQALNISLSAAFGLVRVPIFLLTAVRSVVAVGLVAASFLAEGPTNNQPKSTNNHPKKVDAPKAAVSPVEAGGAESNGKGKKYDDWLAYRLINPQATPADAARALGVSAQTIRNYQKVEANR